MELLETKNIFFLFSFTANGFIVELSRFKIDTVDIKESEKYSKMFQCLIKLYIYIYIYIYI